MPVSIGNLSKDFVLGVLYDNALKIANMPICQNPDEIRALRAAIRQKLDAGQFQFEEVDFGRGSVFLGLDFTTDQIDMARYNERYGEQAGENLVAELQAAAAEHQLEQQVQAQLLRALLLSRLSSLLQESDQDELEEHEEPAPGNQESAPGNEGLDGQAEPDSPVIPPQAQGSPYRVIIVRCQHGHRHVLAIPAPQQQPQSSSQQQPQDASVASEQSSDDEDTPRSPQDEKGPRPNCPIM